MFESFLENTRDIANEILDSLDYFNRIIQTNAPIAGQTQALEDLEDEWEDIIAKLHMLGVHISPILHFDAPEWLRRERMELLDFVDLAETTEALNNIQVQQIGRMEDIVRPALNSGIFVTPPHNVQFVNLRWCDIFEGLHCPMH